MLSAVTAKSEPPLKHTGRDAWLGAGADRVELLSLDHPSVQEFLERTLRTWLGLPADTEERAPSLPERLARRVLRVEEYERQHRDRWGCWEFGHSESFWEGRLLVPEIDAFVHEQRSALALASPWPEGRRFAVCLTHDVDFVSEQLTPSQTLRALRAGFVDGGNLLLRAARPSVRLARALVHGVRRQPATASALGRCVELEREYGVKSSYFFTVFPQGSPSRYDCVYVPRDRCRFDGKATTIGETMCILAAEGFDVGLHGSYNSALVAGLLASEKEALEQALGAPVTSTRQHFLHWHVAATPALQEAAGLEVDSTLGFNRAIGFRAGTSLPFRQFDLITGEARRLLEVPVSIHDGPLLRADGLELDTESAIEAALQLVREVEAVGGLSTLLFHPNSISDPRFEAVYRAVLEYALDRGAWIASLRDVADWWTAREQRLAVSASSPARR